jgi:hypothetical protein
MTFSVHVFTNLHFSLFTFSQLQKPEGTDHTDANLMELICLHNSIALVYLLCRKALHPLLLPF